MYHLLITIQYIYSLGFEIKRLLCVCIKQKPGASMEVHKIHNGGGMQNVQGCEESGGYKGKIRFISATEIIMQEYTQFNHLH